MRSGNFRDYFMLPQIDAEKLIQFKQVARNTERINRREVNVNRFLTIRHSLLDI